MANIVKRVMAFVDGTNFLMGIGRELQLDLEKFRAEKPDETVIQLAHNYVCDTIPLWVRSSQHFHIRSYWFGSYQGNDEDKKRISGILRKFHFEPVLFRKRGGREKGVDIALTMSMLTNAFNQNYDIGFLFAGDEDYVELVKEVKRYGPIIVGSYFKDGLSVGLELSFDYFEYPQTGAQSKGLISQLKHAYKS
jgi:uncharacterized LabA/DUF88 family protein